MVLAKKVTMQQIADRLGISKFAVSKALSGKPGVSSLTRDKIYQAANEMGYFVQQTKYSVYSVAPNYRSNGVVVVLFPEIRYQTADTYYWGPIIEGITEELKQQNLNMVLLPELGGERVSKIINLASLDGVITVGLVPARMLEEVHAHGVPIVMIDHDEPAIPADKLFMDNFESMKQLTNQLIGMGHRSFQYVGDIRFSRSFYERWLGIRVALEEHGIPYEQDSALLDLTNDVFYTNREMKEVLGSLIERRGLPDVLMCGNDIIGAHAISALQELGRSVPQHCSVTGFDNNTESVRISPKLTTIDVPKGLMGSRAVQMLLWRKLNRKFLPETVLLPGRIIIRESISLGR